MADFDMSKLLNLAAKASAETAALPCYEKSDDEGTDACEAARTFETCRWAGTMTCPRRRVHGRADEADLRLKRAGVPVREIELLVQSYRRNGTVLTPTEALCAVQKELFGGRALLALVGPRGVGKTLAACHAIGQLGGHYVTAYQFSRPGLDIEALKGGAALVVDQLGRENISASEFALSALEEIIDARYANRRLTILVGNINREQFIARYGGIIDDRIAGDGEFVVCHGHSMRREQPPRETKGTP
jgi:hypothetical protein